MSGMAPPAVAGGGVAVLATEFSGAALVVAVSGRSSHCRVWSAGWLAALRIGARTATSSGVALICCRGAVAVVVLRSLDLGLEDAQRATETPGGIRESLGAEEQQDDSQDRE